jgi:hypothetical protein
VITSFSKTSLLQLDILIPPALNALLPQTVTHHTFPAADPQDPENDFTEEKVFIPCWMCCAASQKADGSYTTLHCE